jgi:hypothetical protein
MRKEAIILSEKLPRGRIVHLNRFPFGMSIRSPPKAFLLPG